MGNYSPAAPHASTHVAVSTCLRWEIQPTQQCTNKCNTNYCHNSDCITCNNFVKHIQQPLFVDNMGKLALDSTEARETTQWPWHQLDHRQVIYTSLQTDRDASNSPINVLQTPNRQCQSTEGKTLSMTLQH